MECVFNISVRRASTTERSGPPGESRGISRKRIGYRQGKETGIISLSSRVRIFNNYIPNAACTRERSVPFARLPRGNRIGVGSCKLIAELSEINLVDVIPCHGLVVAPRESMIARLTFAQAASIIVKAASGSQAAFARSLASADSSLSIERTDGPNADGAQF